MPTYTWNLPSGANIVYNRGPGGFLEIKYKNKNIKMNTDEIRYMDVLSDANDSEIGNAFLDAASLGYGIYLTPNHEGEYELTLERSSNIEKSMNIPNDLANKLIEIGQAIRRGHDMPPQTGGRRRKARKTRKSRKARKSRKVRKA